MELRRRTLKLAWKLVEFLRIKSFIVGSINGNSILAKMYSTVIAGMQTGEPVTINNYKINVLQESCKGGWIGANILIRGSYEPGTTYVFKQVLKEGMVAIDVGAHMGLYTLFASKLVGENGIVLAVEPSEREFCRLKANLELNHVTNVRLIRVAVSNRRSEAVLLIASEEHSGHNTLGDFAYDSTRLEGKQLVRTGRLDDIVQQEGLSRIDVIKMDIEGSELFALEGASNTLKQFHPVLLI